MVPLPAARETQALGRAHHRVGCSGASSMVQDHTHYWCYPTHTSCNAPKPTTMLEPPHWLVQALAPMVQDHTHQELAHYWFFTKPNFWCETTSTIGATSSNTNHHQHQPPQWLVQACTSHSPNVSHHTHHRPNSYQDQQFTHQYGKLTHQ